MKHSQMPKPRILVAKVLFNEDEYRDFNQACAAADVSQSRTLRDLARGWVEQRNNDKPPRSRMEWPVTGQNMAMSLPGRANFGMPRHHMRM